MTQMLHPDGQGIHILPSFMPVFSRYLPIMQEEQLRPELSNAHPEHPYSHTMVYGFALMVADVRPVIYVGMG